MYFLDSSGMDLFQNLRSMAGMTKYRRMANCGESVTTTLMVSQLTFLTACLKGASQEAFSLKNSWLRERGRIMPSLTGKSVGNLIRCSGSGFESFPTFTWEKQISLGEI